MDVGVRLEVIARQIRGLAEELESLRAEVAAPTSAAAPARAEAICALVGFLALGPTLEEDSLLRTILQCAMRVTAAGGAGLTLLEHKTGKLVFRAAIGDGASSILGYEVPLTGSVHGLAFATGEVQASAPLHAEIEAAAGTRFRNVLVAPLMADDEPIGTLSAVNKERGEAFTVQDMEAYQLFSDLAALIVRQRLRESQLRQVLSGADPGTAEWSANLALGPRDQELLALADQMARLAQRRSGSVAILRQIVTALEREAPGPVR